MAYEVLQEIEKNHALKHSFASELIRKTNKKLLGLMLHYVKVKGCYFYELV